MELALLRHNSGADSTIGLLFDASSNEWLGYTCEDEGREIKLAGETRVPAGRYEIQLRGGETPMNRRYRERFGAFHVGMLWLQAVPGFEFVYIHIGNDDDDTSGCILVGWNAQTDTASMGGRVGRSTDCYLALYDRITSKLLDGERVFIRIADGIDTQQGELR